MEEAGVNLANAAIGIVLASVFVEGVVNVINNAATLYKDWKYWAAILVSVLAAVVYSLDLFEGAGLDARVPFVGMVFTGIIISRGSNYLADILRRITGR
jgi:hypothetical protein